MTHPSERETPAACAGCSRLDRRDFLSSASLLSLGALLAACGDGIIDGPASTLQLATSPVTVDFGSYPALRQIGGRAVIDVPGRAPMVVETVGVRQYRAFSLVCPHKGTAVETTETGYLCPNHLARFDRTGTWVGGQPTGDLTPVNLSVVDSETLLVGGPYLPPTMAVSAASMAFQATIGGAAPAAQTIAISNTGGGTLAGLALAFAYGNNQPTGWLTASLASLTGPTTLTLSANRGTLAAGTYIATVTVSAAGTTNAPQVIAVSLVVSDPSAPAALQLSTSTIAMSTPLGGLPANQTVSVVNAGGGTLSGLTASIAYGAGATGWLSTSSLNQTTAPAVLTLRATTTGLAVGTYTATVTISGTGVTARTVTVTLTVVSAGLAVTIANWPTLASVGGVAGSVGTLNFQNVAVVRTGASTYVAFGLRCPHEGIGVQVVNGQSFRCPGHGATWNADGTLMASSPLRTGALTRLTVTYTPGDPVLYVS